MNDIKKNMYWKQENGLDNIEMYLQSSDEAVHFCQDRGVCGSTGATYRRMMENDVTWYMEIKKTDEN